MNVRAFDRYDFKICVSSSAQIEGINYQCDGGPEYTCFFESLAGKELQNPNNYKNKYEHMEIIKLENNG
ncbi:hypothetical protein ANCCAN_10989 [Ancylostoma caninum]|uniref:Uncharacterized protein n=1 Tax=Ancylostoma caninum TaxID=29170 RepID=A0A368GIG8_ANCCA|nr:hypothetical protein ANCCAN_10989 [Ancylostoma caninum]